MLHVTNQKLKVVKKLLNYEVFKVVGRILYINSF